jgi:hypothetical protein
MSALKKFRAPKHQFLIKTDAFFIRSLPGTGEIPISIPLLFHRPGDSLFNS